MAVAVTLGAMGAHFLEARIPADSLASWQTAVHYHVYHSLAIIIISLAGSKGVLKPEMIRLPLWLMTTGILLFSGSIYFLSTKTWSGLNVSWLGPVTPFGGICFIAAWVILFLRLGRDAVND